MLGRYDVTASSAVTRTEAALLVELGDTSGFIVDAGVPVTARVIDRATSLAVIGRAGIGVVDVDLEAAADHGVTVVHDLTDSIRRGRDPRLLAGARVRSQALRVRPPDARRCLGLVRRGVRSDGSRGPTVGVLGFGRIPVASPRWSTASAAN